MRLRIGVGASELRLLAGYRAGRARGAITWPGTQRAMPKARLSGDATQPLRTLRAEMTTGTRFRPPAAEDLPLAERGDTPSNGAAASSAASDRRHDGANRPGNSYRRDLRIHHRSSVSITTTTRRQAALVEVLGSCASACSCCMPNCKPRAATGGRRPRLRQRPRHCARHRDADGNARGAPPAISR